MKRKHTFHNLKPQFGWYSCDLRVVLLSLFKVSVYSERIKGVPFKGVLFSLFLSNYHKDDAGIVVSGLHFIGPVRKHDDLRRAVYWSHRWIHLVRQLCPTLCL